MGNILPCLVQASSRIMPRVNTKQWSRSMKFLSRTLHRTTTKRPHCSNRVVQAADDQATPRTRSRSRGTRIAHNRRVVRVKVILTRAEAARLISFTTHGDRTAEEVVAEFKRSQATGSKAISELKRMEPLIARADTTSASASMAWRPVLQSIPEEW